jgi:hypothetical protein
MRRSLNRNLKFLLWIIPATLSLWLIGCENPFNPKAVYNSQTYTIRANTNPRNVLENLQASYNQQDLNLFIKCLSLDFRFELLSADTDIIGIDMDGDGYKDNWWDYEKEVEYHRNLFNNGSDDVPSPDNIYLNFQIPHAEAWQTDEQEGREDWVIIPVYFNLTLTLYGSTDVSADGYARFHLRPEGDEWRIVIWRDESNI